MPVATSPVSKGAEGSGVGGGGVAAGRGGLRFPATLMKAWPQSDDSNTLPIPPNHCWECYAYSLNLRLDEPKPRASSH